MAGDWIKMRADLFTHPKVVRISSALKADTLRTVGGLMSVWCLFDAHSEDGTLHGYSLETLDAHLRWSGFAQAMTLVGWLVVQDNEDGISLALPRFDTHNGQSAKRRAQDADRKKAVRKTSALEADEKRTREEKRREEVNNKVVSDHVPEKFGAFWDLWPSSCRKVDKAKCVKKWKAEKLNLFAEQILSHVAQMKRSKQWLEGYEPSPLTYLNGRRWEDGEPSGSSCLPGSELFAGCE